MLDFADFAQKEGALNFRDFNFLTFPTIIVRLVRYLGNNFVGWSVLQRAEFCVMNNNIYLLQLGCHPVAVVILHVNKT